MTQLTTGDLKIAHSEMKKIISQIERLQELVIKTDVRVTNGNKLDLAISNIWAVTRESRNSYNLVRIDAGTGQGEIHLRAWSDRGGGFWHADTDTYHNVPDGVYRFAQMAHLNTT